MKKNTNSQDMLSLSRLGRCQLMMLMPLMVGPLYRSAANTTTGGGIVLAEKGPEIALVDPLAVDHSTEGLLVAKDRFTKLAFVEKA